MHQTPGWIIISLLFFTSTQPSDESATEVSRHQNKGEKCCESRLIISRCLPVPQEMPRSGSRQSAIPDGWRMLLLTRCRVRWKALSRRASGLELQYHVTATKIRHVWTSRAASLTISPPFPWITQKLFINENQGRGMSLGLELTTRCLFCDRMDYFITSQWNNNS